MEGHVATRHPLKPKFGSHSSYIFEGLKEVNSYHNFGIRTLKSNLVESACDSEGNIEAFEHLTLSILGQMWHPERETPFLEEHIKLIKEVFS